MNSPISSPTKKKRRIQKKLSKPIPEVLSDERQEEYNQEEHNQEELFHSLEEGVHNEKPEDEKTDEQEPNIQLLLKQMKEIPNDSLSPSIEELSQLIISFKNNWIPLKASDISYQNTVLEAARRFGDTIVNTTDEGLEETLEDLVFTDRLETIHIQIAYNKELFAWSQLQYLFRINKLLDIGGLNDKPISLEEICDSGIDFALSFKQIATAMLSCKKLLEGHKAFLRAMNPIIDAAAPTNLDPFEYMPFDSTAKFTPQQELLIFMLNKLREHGYRKFRGNIWKPIMTEPLETGTFIKDKEGNDVALLQRVPTLAWEPVQDYDTGKSLDMENFIVNTIRKEDYFRQWQHMTNITNFRSVVDNLLKGNEIEFSTLKPNRDFISFKNGILDIRGIGKQGPKFYTFPLKETLRISHVVANNFIRGKFGADNNLTYCNGWPTVQDLYQKSDRTHPDYYQTKKEKDEAKDLIPWDQLYFMLNDVELYGENWKTETFNNIFHDQLKFAEKDAYGKITKEAGTLFWDQDFTNYLRLCSEKYASKYPLQYPHKDLNKWDKEFLQEQDMREYSHMFLWHYALIGRLLFRLGDKDKWQIIQMIKGVAGCGKSTILNLVGKFFRPEDVETLSNQTRGGGKAIGILETIYDKYLWRVYEVKENFGLDQSAFQSMVSGEIVPVDRLNKHTISVTWDVPGILAGNEFGGWRDNSGSILRRVVISNFSYIIDEAHKDPNMPQKLDAELPAIIHKCLLAYTFMTAMYDGCDIWQVLPQYFRWTRQKLSAASDPFAAFLNTCNKFVHNSNMALPLTVIYKEFQEYASTEGIPRHIVTKIGSLEEDKIKPSLTSVGLKYTRVTAANYGQIKEALKSYNIPKNYNQTPFIVVEGIGMEEQEKE